jgi:hemolysin-activating ACP:hemolysin acyltransferase
MTVADRSIPPGFAAGTSRMRAQDWKSGDRLWVVEVIARSAAPTRW